MNKKALSMVITLLSLAILTTTLVGPVQACGCRPWHRRITEPYYAEYVVRTIQPPTTEEKGDYIISKGSVAQGDYDGPLGTGTMTAELIIYVYNTVAGTAWSTHKNTLVITSGPYGAGTLVGFSWFTYEGSPPHYKSGGTFLWGTGDLRGIVISAEKGMGPTGIWEDGWITHP